MKIKKIISLILALTTVLLLASCSIIRKSIDIKDFVTVTFDSYNGYSSPEMEVDYNIFTQQFDTEKMVRYFKKVCPEDAQLYNQYGDDKNISTYFSIEFEKDYHNLSNGDKVVVKPVVSEEMESAGQTIEDVEKGLGVNIKEAEFTVEGLEDAKGIEVIKNINEWISYDGVSGEARAKIDGPDGMKTQTDDFYFTTSEHNTNSISVVRNNTLLGTIGVFFEETSSINAYDLKEGDTLHVYLTGQEVFEKLDEAGYVVARTKFEVTVPDLGDYVTAKHQLNEKNIKAIQNAVLEDANQDNKNARVISKYFATAKPGVACDTGKANLIAFVIEKDGFWGKEIYTYDVHSIIKSPDGEIKYKFDSGYKGRNKSETEVYNTFLHDKYTFEKI